MSASESDTRRTSLPLELIDYIIDHLHADSSSLAICGLICKGWVPSTRYHLFGAVILTDEVIHKFLDLLESPHLTIAPYVRTLEIDQYQINPASKLTDQCDGWLNTFTPHLKKFSAIESLRLSLTLWGVMKLETQEALLSGCRGIKELVLFHVWFPSFTTVLDVLCAFPLLGKIGLQHVICDTTLANTSDCVLPSPYSTLRHLRALRLDGFPYSPNMKLLKWLISIGQISQIEDLSLGLNSGLAWGEIADCLCVLGPTLIRLQLHFQGRLAQAEFVKRVDIKHNVALRSITFRGYILFDTAQQRVHGITKPFWTMLSQISSPHLEELIISTYKRLPPTSLATSVDWLTVDELLARPQFANLRKFRFSLSPHFDPPVPGNTRSWMWESMPGCVARGILQFD